jgi:hypothetical protein
MYEDEPLQHIATGYQHAALIRLAVHKGVAQARGDYFHTLMVVGPDDLMRLRRAGTAREGRGERRSPMLC